MLTTKLNAVFHPSSLVCNKEMNKDESNEQVSNVDGSDNGDSQHSGDDSEDGGPADIPENMYHCLYTCSEDRVFVVHTKYDCNYKSLIAGVNMTCRSVMSHFQLSSSSGTFVGHSREYVERKDKPTDMSVVSDGAARRLLIVADCHEATIHACGPEMLVTSRISWRRPLSGPTVMLSGMDNGWDTKKTEGEEEEGGGGEQKQGETTVANKVAPFILVEVDRRGLTGYGPGMRIPKSIKKKKEKNS